MKQPKPLREHDFFSREPLDPFSATFWDNVETLTQDYSELERLRVPFYWKMYSREKVSLADAVRIAEYLHVSVDDLAKEVLE